MRNDDLVYRWIIVPVIAIFGMYITEVLIQDFFEIPEAANRLFWALGGIGFFAFYFKSLFDR